MRGAGVRHTVPIGGAYTLLQLNEDTGAPSR